MNLNFFYQKIGSVMKDNKFDREVTGYRSGALDTNRLYKSQLNSDRLFKRKQERQNKKYNVVLLIDESGSMDHDIGGNWDRYGWNLWRKYYSKGQENLRDQYEWGDDIEPNDYTRYEMAGEVASLLVSGLEKNNIDFAILGYNGKLNLHKSFDKPLKFGKRHELRNEIIKYSCGETEDGTDMIGCNHDLLAVKEAHKMLKGRAGTNIVVIFSDGVPNCDYSGCKYGKGIHYERKGHDLVKAEAHKLQKIATVLTFGIGTSEVQSIYPNCQVVNTAEEFMDKTINSLNKLIKRG